MYVSRTLAFQFASKGEISLSQDKQINTGRLDGRPRFLGTNDLFTDAVDLSEGREIAGTHEMEFARRTRLLAVGDDHLRGGLVPPDEVDAQAVTECAVRGCQSA